MRMLSFAVVLFLSTPCLAQYYYMDVVGTKESNDLIASYRKNNVKNVTLKSYTINNAPIENLSVQQNFSPTAQTLLTITKTDYLAASYLTAFFDEVNHVIKTTDSSANGVTTTLYKYDNAGRLASILTTVGDNMASLKTDEHQWQWDGQNRIGRMLRIRNGKDTSVVNFKWDGAGNVIEEQEAVRFIKEEPVYYYYDSKNRLTDIVRYNKKAARLLPEQMLEYNSNNQVSQRITVPQGSDDYLVWKYRYDNNGLKTTEEIYNKQKEHTGKVEYTYTFSK